MEITQIIKYFKECYEADQRELSIYNIFDAKIEQKLFVEGKEEILTGNLPYQYLAQEVAKKLLIELEIFQKEKYLFYFSFFVTGNLDNQAICAPLFYYPAEIVEVNQDFYYKIDFNKQIINYPLLLDISQNYPDNYIELLYNMAPKDAITFEELVLFLKKLTPYLNEVSLENAYLFPELNNAAVLKKNMQIDKLQLNPASVLGIITTSVNTRGVLNELSQIGEKNDFSIPIKTIFDEGADLDKIPIAALNNFIQVPTLLSLAQKNILQAAQNYPLSLIVGPPGTGKSYTIAALAVDALTKGQSVLIASKMDHAIEVVYEKIKVIVENVDTFSSKEEAVAFNDFSNVVQVGKEGLSKLKKDIEALLHNIGIPSNEEISLEEKQSQLISKNIESLKKDLHKNEHIFRKKITKEAKYLDFLQKYKQLKSPISKWFFYLKKAWIDKKIKQQKLLPNSSNELLNDIHKQIKKQTNFTIRKQLGLVKTYRKDLKLFLSALKARRDSKQEKIFKEIDFKKILEIFPIWLVNTHNVYDTLPLEKEIFDIAIIDEASQCDIASCLPILQRAKKVVIAGDPQQLRHLSFLSIARQNVLKEKYQLIDEDFLNYREKSLLDAISNAINHAKAVSFLNEHYRSYPTIIDFSNQQFYGNNLLIMTPHHEKSITLLNCQGKRNEAGYNEIEADFIITEIQKIVENNLKCTIGILSPFRAQVDYIAKLLKQTFSLEIIQAYQIAVGTAHTFQGREKDYIFISFVVDKEAHHGSFMHLNNPNLFNVAITRAKQKQFVLASVYKEDIKTESLFYQYLNYIENIDKNLTSNAMNASDFVNILKTLFPEDKYTFINNYTIANFKLDILITRKADNKKFGIYLIDNLTISPNRILDYYYIFKRINLEFMPIFASYWHIYEDKCKEEIFTYINQTTI